MLLTNRVLVDKAGGLVEPGQAWFLMFIGSGDHRRVFGQVDLPGYECLSGC